MRAAIRIFLVGAGIACAAIVGGAAMFAQQTGASGATQNPAEKDAGPPTAFEVASVRPVPEGRQGLFSITPWGSGLFMARNISLRLIIALAYQMDDHNVVGMPGSVAEREFDISARVQGQAKLSYAQMQPLLQSLLRERFHLAVRHDTKDEEGYELVVAKGGPKLTQASTSPGMPSILPTGVQGEGITMAVLAGILSRPLGRPTVDKTGLNGNYEVTLHYRAADSDDSTLPSIFTALTEQLGLKVVPAKVPVDILVVDHVDAEPTAQ